MTTSIIGCSECTKQVNISIVGLIKLHILCLSLMIGGKPVTVFLCFCDVGGDMQFASHYIREEDSLQARHSLFTFNRSQHWLLGFSHLKCMKKL